MNDHPTVGIRPEDVRVAEPEKALLAGDVQIAEQLGGETFVYVALPAGGSMTVEIKGQAKVRAGERVGLNFSDEAFHGFAADGQVLPRLGREATR